MSTAITGGASLTVLSEEKAMFRDAVPQFAESEVATLVFHLMEPEDENSFAITGNFSPPTCTR